jgi:hypothetical protein
LVDGVCSELHLELTSTYLAGGRDAVVENCFCFLATVLHSARDVESYIAIARDLLKLSEEGGSPFLPTLAEFRQPRRKAPRVNNLLGLKESRRGELPYDVKALFDEIISDPSVLGGGEGESFNQAVVRYCSKRALVDVPSDTLKHETKEDGYLFHAKGEALRKGYVVKREFGDGGKGVKRVLSGMVKDASQVSDGQGVVKGNALWTDARQRLLVASLRQAGNVYQNRWKFPSQFVAAHAVQFDGVKAQVVSSKLKNIFKMLYTAEVTGANVPDLYKPLLEPRILICPKKKDGEWRTSPGGW